MDCRAEVQRLALAIVRSNADQSIVWRHCDGQLTEEWMYVPIRTNLNVRVVLYYDPISRAGMFLLPITRHMFFLMGARIIARTGNS